MATAAKGTLAAAESKKTKTATPIVINNGSQKSSLLFIPRQVFMNMIPPDNPTKANISNTKSQDASKMNEKKVNLKFGQVTGFLRSNSTYWSPIMDGIEGDIPLHIKYVIGNFSRSNGTASRDSKDVIEELIQIALYGPRKSSLPIFEEMCRE